MNLKFNIDAAALSAQFKEFALEVQQDLQKAVSNLASITHAKVVEMANQELKTSRQPFMDSLGFEEITPGVWVISVDESGLWVEEGIESSKDMKPDLLKEDSKVSKSGNRYKVIPFKYDKAPSQTAPSAQMIVAHLKDSLKKENIPFKKIERNANGSPKLGKLHELDFGNPGGRMGGPGRGNTPALKGLTIYQHMTATGGVKRSMMTFRTVSSGAASADKWIHPGSKGKKYLDRALLWAENVWEQEILPQVMEKWK